MCHSLPPLGGMIPLKPGPRESFLMELSAQSFVTRQTHEYEPFAQGRSQAGLCPEWSRRAHSPRKLTVICLVQVQKPATLRASTFPGEP